MARLAPQDGHDKRSRLCLRTFCRLGGVEQDRPQGGVKHCGAAVAGTCADTMRGNGSRRAGGMEGLEHKASQWWVNCVVEVAFSIRGDEAAPYRMTKPSLGTGTGTEPPFSMQKVAQCAQRRRVPGHERAPVDTVLYAIWYVCSMYKVAVAS